MRPPGHDALPAGPRQAREDDDAFPLFAVTAEETIPAQPVSIESPPKDESRSDTPRDLFGRPLRLREPSTRSDRNSNLNGRLKRLGRTGRGPTSTPYDLFSVPSSPAPVDTAQEPPPREVAPEADPVSLAAPEPPTVPRIASGEKSKARDLLAAIRILKAVEQEGRAATLEEREGLARFAGFGPIALSIFPDPVTGRYKDRTWEELGEELRGLVSPEEYASAKRTTFNAFYTSPTVVRSMHAALQRLGIPERATVLEPGCGTGTFLSLAPAGMRFIGVELDLLTGRIARALHPGQDIRIENFRDTRLQEESLDAVIGNVPFADLKLEHRGQRLSLHDFFFAKAVDLLRPGGVLALVTSHFTLDKQNGALREYLAARSNFVGAIRLPSDAFKLEGTSVVTDIVFLRRRGAAEPASHADPGWLSVAPLPVEGADVVVNRYFLDHPEMVLGAWSRRDTLYGEGYSVRATGELAQQLDAAIARLPLFSPIATAAPLPPLQPVPALPPPEAHIVEGSFLVDERQVICRWVDGRAVPVVYGGRTLRSNGTPGGRRLAALIRLRDLARRVLRSQNEGWAAEERQAARLELNRAYDAFVWAYGPINRTTVSATADGRLVRRMPNVVPFREDPDAMLVLALEEYDETSGTAAKAAILQKDVVGRHAPVTSVRSAEEGLLQSLNQRGSVELPFIAGLYGKAEEAVLGELGDLVFHDPASGRYETADAYLSGNVRRKLNEALSAGPAYARNVERLSAVQPEDVLPGDIDANLGAPWIPPADIEAFAAAVFGVASPAVQVAHLPAEAAWSIDADESAKRSVGATAAFGTPRANGIWLLELALNMKSPTIYDTVERGDREERVVNQEATLAAREKQKLLKERFRAWVFADPERTERLVRLYNDTYNNLRPRLFDGSHLDFPGMNDVIRLREHQRNAIWRCMSAGNTLLAQAVGAGKTYIMAAAGMKMRQAGLIRKPLYVVPNHMLEQFGREFLQLYPNARLLIAGKEDLARERRKQLTARIASGDWDGIVVTHSSFERIGMSRDYQASFLREQIATYERLLCDGAGAAGRAQRNLIKQIEKQKAAREERLKDLLAEDKKDDGLVFDELGIDHLFIDEAQYYKNLETPTKMERVAGIQTGGSERAFDLYMKARYLHARHPGHGLTFATGTPISNTMVEMYTMQRFLDPEGLLGRGIDHFDAWAATFGEVVDTMEIAPDGKSLKPRSRFARFTNLPELQQMFRAFSDVQTAEMLTLPRPRLEGGKAQVIACPMSEEQSNLQRDLVARYERLRSQKVDPREDNALAITTDGRKLALDARLLSGAALDFTVSKINALVEQASALWQRTAARRSTQLIFCDMGVHPTPWGYSVYEEIREKLVARGIPRGEIAAIGEADTDQKKQGLFERVRSGQVRILLGSTAKMGTGTNVQKRLIALHHLDAPWKPAEVEQREGRILRQGNENEEIAIYRYVTEGSFDAYMWQALETKARFIAQVMTGENALRRAEDIGGQELSYAEVKAIASGNPAVLTLAQADAELQRLSILKRNHADEQYIARLRLRELPRVIADVRNRLAALTADLETATNSGEAVTIGNRSVSAETAVDALVPVLSELPREARDERRYPIGTFRGLGFGLVLRPQWPTDVYLEGRGTLRSSLSREHQGPRAILNAVERLSRSYEPECSRLRQDLAIAEAQLRDYQARFGSPFEHDGYLAQLASLRDQLKACLAGAPAQPSTEAPSAIAIANEIASLTSTYCLHEAPARQGRQHVTAEESVTTRIRRRIDGALGSSEATS